MSNNFLVKQIVKACGSFFVGATIAIGTLCPKVLAQSTHQLIIEWASEQTNNSQITLWLYNDNTYIALVKTISGSVSVKTTSFNYVYGTYSITGSITGNTIRFDLGYSTIQNIVTSASGGIGSAPTETFNEQGQYVVYSFSTINNGQTLLLNQIGGNVTAPFPPLQLIFP